MSLHCIDRIIASIDAQLHLIGVSAGPCPEMTLSGYSEFSVGSVPRTSLPSVIS